MSLGDWFATFRKIVAPPYSVMKQSRVLEYFTIEDEKLKTL